jgi:hypothetical protein
VVVGKGGVTKKGLSKMWVGMGAVRMVRKRSPKENRRGEEM